MQGGYVPASDKTRLCLAPQAARVLAVFLAWAASIAGGASGRDVCFSEPPDLNGLLQSSEIISSIGLESRVADDF